ncbi:MAG: protein kinase, partial [Elusimicrobia bacterium]|nr:protein kinase [Elusimicrobiota bacterium]
GARDEKASFATVSPANSRAAAASGSPLAAGIKALNRAGLYRRGLAAADQALRVSPRDAYAHYMRAMALRGLGDRNGTLAELGKAAALDGRYRDAYALARSLGPNDDLSFLFPEEQLSAAKAALARRRAAAWPWMALPLVAGAGLALFGLSGLLFPGLGRRLRRLWRPGPALGRGQTAGLSAPAPWGLAPQTLGGRYRLLSAMGGGVHGDLYRALDQASGRPVVVRSLRLDMRSSDRQLWLGPARLARSLEHPGIAALLDVLEEDGALHLVSQFAEGRCLRESLAFEGALRWESAHAVFRQVAAALDYAHGRGVVHGAIKPSNIVVDASGAAKLTDFGLARHGAERGRDLQDLAACLRRSLGELPSTRSKVLDSALSGAAARASAGELVAAVAACPR